MQRLLLRFAGLLLIFQTVAQNETDIYRYSNTFNEGSARFEAMSGSFGALGADFGSARINPAGFGRFSSNQFNLGLISTISNTTSTFRGVETDADRFNMKLGTLGLVLASDMSANQSGWLYTQFAVGYNSIANFKNDIHYSGSQFESILDGFGSQATGYAPEYLASDFPFSTSLAYEAYLLEYDASTQSYYSYLTSADVMHNREVSTRGGMGEFFFSGSGNYLNKLYVGVNVGLQLVNYKERTFHQETVLDTANTTLRGLDYEYNLKSSGTGSNIKIGAIYLPTESFRLGLALHTKTFLTLTDNYSANMTGYYADTTYYVPEDLQPSGVYKYKLRTPARAVASLAYIFQNHGCINVDVEYLNYGKGRLRPDAGSGDSYNFSAENSAASGRFNRALNVRIGGEVVFRSMIFLRGGLAFYQKGDSAIVNTGGKYDMGYSAGFGVRINQWTFDASFRALNQTFNYYAFPGSYADVTRKTYYIALTGMIKF